MTLIPANHIPSHEGEPQRVELLIQQCEDHEHHATAVFAIPMTPEEVASAKARIRDQINAVATLSGQEIPDELAAALDELDEVDEIPSAMAVGETFQLCWN